MTLSNPQHDTPNLAQGLPILDDAGCARPQPEPNVWYGLYELPLELHYAQTRQLLRDQHDERRRWVR